MVLVGASGLRCFLKMAWRTTEDLDLSVAASAEDVTAALDSLQGWSQDPRLEHDPWNGEIPKSCSREFWPSGVDLVASVGRSNATDAIHY